MTERNGERQIVESKTKIKTQDNVLDFGTCI